MDKLSKSILKSMKTCLLLFHLTDELLTLIINFQTKCKLWLFLLFLSKIR